MIKFRDQTIKENNLDLIVHINQEGVNNKVGPITHGSKTHTDIMKTQSLKQALNKISLLLSYKSLKKFKAKLDPRKYNGAIFLGLQGPVVKSHGATDALGFAYSIQTCNKIVKSDLIKKIKSNLITVEA